MKKSNLLADNEHKIRELEQVKSILMKMIDLAQFKPSNVLSKTQSKNTESKNKIVSFRIPESVLESLEQQAQSQNKNINILVREILRKYAEWDKIYSKFQTIVIPKTIFDLSISDSDDSKIDEIVSELHLLLLDLILARHENTEFDSIVLGMEDFLRDIHNEFEHVLVGNKQHFSVMCPQDTIFGSMLQKLLHSILAKFVDEYGIEFLATKNIFRITWTNK